MICSKKEQPSEQAMLLAEQCRQEAEALYRSGRYHCAESVLAVVLEHFRPDLPEDVVRMASGFGGGSGTGCLCGAVAAGTIGLGLVLKDDKKQIMHLTRELQEWFKGKYGATCCRTIRQADKGTCPLLTGEVAGKVAEMLSD
jgi:C_GCAxxG_C_C family probable redox protein